MSSSANDSNSYNKTHFEDRFKSLLISDLNSDCAFLLDYRKKVIKGHKCVFSSASEVFKALFEGDVKMPIKIEGLSPEAFTGMKTFIYTGKVNFNSLSHAVEIFTAAKTYLIQSLMTECSNFVKKRIQPSNVIKMCDTCKYFKVTEFDDLIFQIIQEKTDLFVRSEDFLSDEYYENDFSIALVEFMLKTPCLNLRSEIELFEYLEKWIISEFGSVAEDGSSYLSDENEYKYLIKHVRFLTISLDDFFSKVSPSLLLTSDEKLALVCNLKQMNSMPMPETLSLEQQPRKFTQSPLKQEKLHDYSHKITFIISLKNPPSSHVGYTIANQNYPTLSLNLTCVKLGKYICFQVEAQKKGTVGNFTELMTLETEIKVLAKEGNNNLIFENTSHMILNWNTKESQAIVFEKILINKFENQSFFVGSEGNETVKIEVSFNITFELGETLKTIVF